jgi:7,8-dihydroneopterin aldolase/epimerase/oxygenase
MNAVITIELKALRFHAFHGLFPEEKKTGNEFEVNLSVDYIPAEKVITNIDNTVNYAQLYAIIKSAMQQPRELLETVAMEIVESIYATFPQIKKVAIEIIKLHPPIAQFVGSVGVRYEKES